MILYGRSPGFHIARIIWLTELSHTFSYAKLLYKRFYLPVLANGPHIKNFLEDSSLPVGPSTALWEISQRDYRDFYKTLLCKCFLREI